jgi:hypothetical protein
MLEKIYPHTLNAPSEKGDVSGHQGQFHPFGFLAGDSVQGSLDELRSFTAPPWP